MSARNNGGPAFPGAWENGGDLNATAPDGQIVPPGCLAHMGGMTLRDYFAAKAMQAYLTGHMSHYGHDNYWQPDSMAGNAYEVADAMLKARQA